MCVCARGVLKDRIELYTQYMKGLLFEEIFRSPGIFVIHDDD